MKIRNHNSYKHIYQKDIILQNNKILHNEGFYCLRRRRDSNP